MHHGHFPAYSIEYPDKIKVIFFSWFLFHREKSVPHYETFHKDKIENINES